MSETTGAARPAIHRPGGAPLLRPAITRVAWRSAGGGLLALALSSAPALGVDPASSQLENRAQAPPQVEIEGPKIVLSSVPLSITLRLPDSAEPTSYSVWTATGRELSRGELLPGEELQLDGLRLASGGDLPLSVRVDGAEQGTVSPRWLPGWISLAPPLVAILLALIVREVVVSLFFGIWLGAFFFAGLNPLAGTWRTIDSFVIPALADGNRASILVFSLLLGGMVGLMSRSGGTRGIVEALRPISTTPRRAQLATWFSGLAIFFDDYANTLIVGNTFRPIMDRVKVSREKLAYIVDSTAAPVASIVFVSTWVGFQISLIGSALDIAAAQPDTPAAVAADLASASPFTVFLHSIPYLFYPILAIVMVGMLIVTKRDFGPMLAAERRARRGEGVYRKGAELPVDTTDRAMEPDEDAPRRWYNAGIPVLTVVFVVLFGLYFDGRASSDSTSLWDVFGAADPFKALLWGSLSGCILAFALSIGQRILTTREAVHAWLAGLKAMMLAAVILTLAWSLGGVTVALGTATYLTQLLSQSLVPELLPGLVFVTAAATAFATGTSWATMAILFPLVIPLSVALGGGVGFEGGGQYTLTLGSISSILAGAIFGDHCSPISDTTVMSSLASACDHVDHVRTQLPYAVAVAIVAIAAGDVPTAFGLHPGISYAIGALVLFALVRFVGKPSAEPGLARAGDRGIVGATAGEA